MRKQGSFEYTKKAMEQYKNRIIQKVTALGGNEELVQLVEKLWTAIP
jgi:hypothetical protein